MESVAKRAKKILAGVAAVTLAGFLYALLVHVTGWAVPCLFRRITGWYCPGCGVTGMAMAMLRLDMKAAYASHPVLFCSLLPLGICLGAEAAEYIKTGQRKQRLWQKVIVWAAAGALILYCLWRNIQ